MMIVRAAFAKGLRSYSAALNKNPIATQIVSSGALWAVGDVVAQRLEGGPFSAKRFVMTSVYGGVFNGTVGHLWYMKLDAVARRVAVPGSARFVAAKVLADSVLFGPVHVGAFFTFLTLAEGGSAADVRKKLQHDLLPSLAAEVTVWPAVQTANFALVPLQYQLLVVNAFTIIDATFMSWVQHNSLREWICRLAPRLAGEGGAEAGSEHKLSGPPAA